MTCLKIFAIISVALVTGKIVTKIKLPAILGWLITGMLFGPYLVGIIEQPIIDSNLYTMFIKTFEVFAGVMIGSEIVFKKIAKYGKQITVITLCQSLGTFLVVTVIFGIIFIIKDIPLYLAFIFGSIALATAPAPALSIVNQYKTEGPVTKTLIPMAALDDIIGIIVFFTVTSIISGMIGGKNVSVINIILMIVLPLIIGVLLGLISSFIIKKQNNDKFSFGTLIAFLLVGVLAGYLCDKLIFHKFLTNYLLIGMAFSATVVNIIPEEKTKKLLQSYQPILNLSLVIVIVNLGMPLDYHLILGAGLYTAIYIISRAIGKIGGAAFGGVITKAEAPVKKYLGLTLLPHSGVSLVFTSLAVNMLTGVDSSSAAIIQGTIAAAAIINEIIAVILARQAFKWANEINTKKAPDISLNQE